jgi:hypothetical protein
MLAAEFAPVESFRPRRSERASVSFEADLDRGGLERALCRVTDLSIHGARLETYSALKRGASIWLTLPGVGQVIADVAWATDFAAGCEFHTPLAQDIFDALVELDGSLLRH